MVLASALGRDPVRDALLRRVETVAAAWAAQDAELDAEIAALDAADVRTVPTVDERPGLVAGPDAAPPDGVNAWVADLPGPLLDEYLAAAADATTSKMPCMARGDRSRDGAVGFAAGGAADALPPGAVLAGLAEGAQAGGLSRLTDDELAGVILAGRRLSSWASALELAAVGDLMRRREQQEAAGHPHAAEHADAEIAALLTLTGRGAGRMLDLAITLQRLPLTARALAAGVIDLPRAAVIADETIGLGDDHAAAVERHILVRAPGQTTSQVRAAARRAVLAADPRAARKRQEHAQREARVERWVEHAGTAALAGRDLPPAEVIAADQHISALARGLRAAGLAGTVDQLRAQVFLTLLSGEPVSGLLPKGQQQSSPTAGGSGTPAGPGMPGASGAPVCPGTPGQWGMSGQWGMPGQGAMTGNTGMAGFPATRGKAGAAAPATPASAGLPGMSAVAGMVNLTMPLRSWLGLIDAPGEVTGFGPLSAGDSRRLAMAMARHGQTRWCVTLTGADGRPVAHGCARPGDGPHLATPGPAPPGHGAGPPGHGAGPPHHDPGPPCHAAEAPDHGAGLPGHRAGPSDHGAGPADHGAGPPGHGPGLPFWLASIPIEWFEPTGCAHQRQSTAYRPPAALQHLIRVRQSACAFPGCRRPASQCDLDHTTPFQHGGLTCECNLAPLCRTHHQAKQAPGWHLAQDQPGHMTWQTPSGRSYPTCGEPYPV